MSMACMVFGTYLEGQGDLLTRLVTPIIHLVISVIPIPSGFRDGLKGLGSKDLYGSRGSRDLLK